MKLSILIPSIPSRIVRMTKLYGNIYIQSENHDVEILCLIDNKKRTIGQKRDALVQMANGEYLTFVDDDDHIKPCYIEQILKSVDSGKDVICPKIECSINGGNKFIASHSILYENQEARIIDGKWIDVTRKPLHNSIWKSELAKSERFPNASYGEDGHWAKRLWPKVKSEYVINEVISSYIYHKLITEAEIIFP